jgi:small subunit ribosomal protein S9
MSFFLASSSRIVNSVVQRTACQELRHLSAKSLPRPPQRKEEPDSRRKWRTHAVPLAFGDYTDDTPVEEETPTTYPWEEEETELSEEVKELQKQEDDQKQRWLKNAKPPVRKPIIDERGRAYGRGGRKTAAARVWIQPGLGNVVVNRKDFVDYFERTTDRELILQPLAATGTCGKFDVTATVEGSGHTGQAGAIRHGLARALNHYNPDDYRPPLKRLGYLTRDPRKVERKKVGHLKARKKPQWVKR